jgi:hypothetical protein
MSIFLHWRTTLAGVAAILGALADAITQVLSGNIGSGSLEKDGIAIVAGIGLIVAADASNVTK